MFNFNRNTACVLRTVNRLKNDYEVQISITETENNNSIRVEGNKENVAQVKKVRKGWPICWRHRICAELVA